MRRLLLWIAVPLLALVAGVGFLVSTETGLRWLLALAERTAPGKLSYAQIEGRLIGPLSLSELHYQDGELEVRIDQADFDWQPSALLAATLHIERLVASGVAAHLPPSPPEPEPEPLALPDIRLPVQVRIDTVDIGNIRIQTAEAEHPVLIEAVRLKAHTQALALVLDTLQIETPEGRFSLDGRLEPVGDYPLSLNLAWGYRVPDLGELDGHGAVTGSLQALTLTHRLSGAATAALDAEVRDVLGDPAWSARLTLSSLDLGAFNPELHGSQLTGTLQTEGTLDAYRLRAGFATQLPQVGTVSAEVEASGGREALRLSRLALRSAERPSSVEVRGEVQLADLGFDASGEWQDLAWPLAGEPQVHSPRGRFTLQGTPRDYRLELDAAATGADIGELRARLRAAGTDEAVRIAELVLSAPDGKLALRAQGALTFADLSFQASGEWQDLAWPLVGEPQVESASGTFQAGGTLGAYEFRMDTTLEGPQVPVSHWQLQGRGSDQALDALTVEGRLLEGEIRGEASARWQPEMSWQAALTGSGLNPGAHWQGLAGSLRFRLQTAGELAVPDNRLRASLTLEELAGTLEGQAVSGGGKLAVDGEDLAVETLALRAGDAALELAGSVAQRWDLRWQLQVPRLASLLPAATGRISGSGTLSGPRQQPQAELSLTVDELAYGAEAIKRLRAEAHLDLTGATRSRLDLSGQELRLGGQPWQRLQVEGAGTPEAHALTATLAGEPGRFELALEGRLQNDTWQGRLTRLAAADTAAGSWTLEGPVALRAAAAEAALGQACLRSPPTRLCLEGEWSARDGAQGRLALTQLTAARFAALLPPDASIDTRLNGEASGELRPDGRVLGTVDFTLSPGSLRTVADGNPIEVALRGGHLRARADGNNATAQLQIDLATTGALDADVRVQDLAGERRLAGTVRARFDDLGLVSVFAPQLQNVSGRVVANVDLGGRLPIPDLAGEVRLENAAADIPEAGTRIEAIQLAVAGAGQGPLRVSGSARSGTGRIDLSGQLDPATRQANIAVRGQDFQAANTPEVQAMVSPDLSLRMDEGQVRVEGEVRIPKAFLSPPDISGGVSPSADVVIVRSAEGEAVDARVQPLAIYVSVRVILGEDVRVAAAGFNGKLQGNLLVVQTPEFPPRGTGTIEVETGKYRIYGQEVDIQRGQVLFAGGPIDNPGLDLRVARSVDDVTVGATVTGTVKTPELLLFSDPSMPNSSILSYLLFGRPPDARSGSESELLMAAASALGMSGGNVVTKRLQSALGLDTFRFESGQADTGASLVLGKYLSPDLYVGYGVGLFQAVNTFTLRYRLGKRLMLESTSTGANSGADLLYTIER